MYTARLLLLLGFVFVSLTSCKRQPTNSVADQSSPSPANQQSTASKFEVCGLIKGEEIETIQGSKITESKSSGNPSTGGMQTGQCFYLAAEFSRSVSLAVTRIDPNTNPKGNIRDYWDQMFARSQEREGDREREREGDKEKKESLREQHREKGEEEGAPLKKVAGIGDEAYWSGSRVGGALYVLKKNAFVRISVGGPDNEETKLEKSKALAQKAIDRL